MQIVSTLQSRRIKMKKYKFYIVIITILSLVIIMCVNSPNEPEDDVAWQTIFFDDFNRPDGPIIGTKYSVQTYGESGSISLSNNQVKLAGGIYYAIIYSNEVDTDTIKVSLKCTTAAEPSGEYAFGVAAKSKYLNETGTSQQFYGGFVAMDKDSLAIYKVSGTTGFPPPLAFKAYNVQINRSYLLELVIKGKDLMFVVQDLSTNAADTLITVDNGTMLTGGTVTINGMQGEGDVVYFDDFKIETN